MIVTKKFVLINIPKTGSTFTRTLLKRLHGCDDGPSGAHFGRRINQFKARSGFFGLREYLMPKNDCHGRELPPDQHGTVSQIPERFKHLPVVTTVRDPFSRIVSSYRFGWWRTNLESIEGVNLKDLFPHYPNLDFEEFLAVWRMEVKARLSILIGHPPKLELGRNTVDLIQMIFRNPALALGQIGDRYIYEKLYLEDMPKVTFLKMERLNEDLYEFLLTQKYEKRQLAFILKEKKISPPGSDDNKESSSIEYFSKEEFNRIKEEEKYYTKILADHGILY